MENRIDYTLFLIMDCSTHGIPTRCKNDMWSLPEPKYGLILNCFILIIIIVKLIWFRNCLSFT